jgi:hypothetical protein
MKKYFVRKWIIAAAFLVAASMPGIGSAQSFTGTWNFDKAQSKNVGGFYESGEIRYTMKILPNGDGKMFIEGLTTTEAGWRTTRLNVDLNGPETTSTFPMGDLRRFSFEAVAIGPDRTIMTKAVQGSDKLSFDLTSYFKVLVSQGTFNVVLQSHYALSADGKTLTITETRNSRKEDEPAVYVFHKAD